MRRWRTWRHSTRACPVAFKQAVERFAETGTGDVKKLQGVNPPEFRLRVGDYRARFHQDGDTIRILRVRNRREAYRD